MILVTGATGGIGAEVVRLLMARDVPVRAFVRNRAKAVALLGPRTELSVGDFADSPSLRRALHGVETVFLSSADGPEKARHEIAVIDAASAAGVTRIVKMSSIGAEVGSPVPFWDAHGRVERRLNDASARAAVLRANFYMSNVLSAAEPVHRQGVLPAPAAGAQIAMVDPRDVAAAAVILLTGSPGDLTGLHVVTGPDAITYDQVAAELSRATGRDVVFVPVPDAAARAAAMASGVPEWNADALVALFQALRSGAAAQTTDTVVRLTGRPPRSFTQFARDHAGAFGADTDVPHRAGVREPSPVGRRSP